VLGLIDPFISYPISMNRPLNKILIGGLLTFIILNIFTHKIDALTIENAEETRNVTITRDVEDDLLVTGEGLTTIEGDVNGDLMVFAEDIVVNGEVDGNVYAFGGVVKLNSIVGKSVFVGGGTVYVNGEVYRDLYVAGGMVFVKGSIGEDLLVAGGEVDLDASVGDDLRVAAGTVKILNTVGGDVLSASGNTFVGGEIMGSVISTGETNLQNSTINGDFIVYGESKDAVIDAGSLIQGEKVVKTYPDFAQGSMWNNSSFMNSYLESIWAKTFLSIFQCFGIVILGYLLFKFAPVRLESILNKMDGVEEGVKSTLTGFIAFPVGTALVIFLAFSVFGWPLLKALVLLALLATSVVTPIAGIMMGRKILPLLGSKRRYIIPLTLGVVIIQLIKVIPIFGWLFYQVIVFMVIGAMLRMQWSKYKMAQNMTIKIAK
jgi:hypothetical protein